MKSLFRVGAVSIVVLVITGLTLAPAVAGPGDHKHSEEKHKLGRQKIADYTVSVIMIGEPEAGHSVGFARPATEGLEGVGRSSDRRRHCKGVLHAGARSQAVTLGEEHVHDT